MEPRSYLSHPPRRSESRLLSDLYALNREFVSLLLAGDGPGPALLEPCLLARLCALSDRQLESLATCPYSLFDLRFDDATAWTEQLDAQAARARGHAHSGGGGYSAAFALSALHFARHLADSYPDLARLLLGMGNDVARPIARLSLTGLASVAFNQPDWLQARLARHPHFWPDLIDFVREGTRERRLAAQTLGVQQSASKL